MILKELQPYFVAASAALGVATLGFILNIVKTIRDNAQDRIAVQEERLKRAEDDHARLEKWSEREKAELRLKLEETKAEVDAILAKEGIDAITLAAGKRLSDTAAELRATTELLVAEMQDKLTKLSALDDAAEISKGASRTLAMVAMASGKYSDAAARYDTYAASGTVSWEDNLSRGIAHANAKDGHRSNLAALMAYNDAIALAPKSLDGNRRAQLFTYRAAMLKRQERFREAENDLSISLELATADIERLDAHYNLACIYAMQGRGDDMRKHLSELEDNSRFRANVANHIYDYFSNFRDDPMVQKLLSL